MDTKQHKEEFDRIITEYSLAKKADDISDYLTKHKNITPKEFASLFVMDEKDALIFLTFIEKGIKFREKNLKK